MESELEVLRQCNTEHEAKIVSLEGRNSLHEEKIVELKAKNADLVVENFELKTRDYEIQEQNRENSITKEEMITKQLDLLEDHIAHNCHGRNNPHAGQREIFPKKGKHISQFNNLKAMLKAPVIIYPDNECDSNKLEEKAEDKDKKPVKIQEQTVNSYGYTLIQNDSKIITSTFRRTVNSVAEKWENMQKDLQIIKEIIRNPVELKMTSRDWERHNTAQLLNLPEEIAFISVKELEREKVATNLRGGVNSPGELAKRFPILAQCIPKKLLPLVSQKSEYPYELNDPDRFSRAKLP
ncbi:hypothetical protein GLOIN_2v1488958 [Rhizophagus clarus]|uniref:Uncharacterized protein n=1 Tax=Rhizophagus clarus TaxID=94130 RepID=A0A8H3QVM1_9GLOM|nr:hypothetical protein GLOIN_2v1488958 [Rhizophagus clarus]